MTTDKVNLPLRKNLLEFKSIKAKLMVIIVVMLIVSGTALTGIAAFMAANQLESAQIDKLTSVGENTSEGLWLVANLGKDIASILSIDKDIQSVLLHARDGTLTPEEQLAVSENLADMIGTVSDIFERINVVDNQGIVIASSFINNIGRDDSGRNVVAHQQKGAYIGEPYIGTGDTPRIPYARPIYDENDQQIGLVYIALNLAEIDEHLFSTPGLSDDSTNFLVDLDGTIFSGVKGDYSPFLKEKFDLSIFPADVPMVQALGYFGDIEYIVKTPFPGTDWFIITTEAVNAVNNPIMNLVMMMVASLLIVIIAGVFVAFFISNSLARPIKALSDCADQLALGDVDVVITHTGIDEIGHLADAFRRMAENMKQKANYVSRIAAGDLGDIASKITAASDRDVEGKALIQMRKTLFFMVEQLQTLANHSAEGDLSYRADATRFQGVYRELIETLNQAFDLIINPLQETMRLSQSYSSGDYSDRFDPDISVQGDFISFKVALNQIGINSSDVLLKIRRGVHDISAGASDTSINLNDIVCSVTILAEGQSRVSSLADLNETSLDQTFTAITDLADTVGEVAQRTNAVSDLASQASVLAYDGVKRAKLAGKGMEEIMESFTMTAKAVSDMSNQMDEIGGIVDVITGIAEQTSLLALNAAIEAARAGDTGLGFAVVANEVKSLAQESQASAEHIGTIIGNLQKMSGEMTNGMKNATNAIQSGNNAVNETISIFNQMAEAIEDVSRNMSEVAAASEEQAASVQEITASMSEVRDMVQDTAREATDSAGAAEKISVSLDQLKDTAAQSAQFAETIEEQVNQFKIE